MYSLEDRIGAVELYPEYDRTSAAVRLYNLQSYPFTVLELSQQVDEEQVADIFVRINSKGVPLNQADFILTLMSVFWDEGRTQLESCCREARRPTTGTASPFNHYIDPDPDQLLRVSIGLGFRRARLAHVYSILRGKDLDTGTFSEEHRENMFAVLQEAQSYVLELANWHEFMNTLRLAGYSGRRMISSRNNLLYTYVLYLIGKRDFGVEPFPLRNAIARWYYMVALTARYTNSPESAMEADLARLRGLHSADDFLWPVRGGKARRHVRRRRYLSPKDLLS